ncbi:zinc finger protein 576 isoform X2 [Urocitellus parryii]
MAPGKRRVKGGVSVTMEDSHPEDTMEQQDSPKERRPSSPGGNICHLGAPQCTRCLITFADSKFQERHMKREHPADFVAQKLQGALFICFTCARSFPSSKALIIHQRSHGPAARPSSPGKIGLKKVHVLPLIGTWTRCPATLDCEYKSSMWDGRATTQQEPGSLANLTGCHHTSHHSDNM